MELSLFGAFACLWLFNPLVLVHTYQFWACFAGVCLYLAVAALIYEVIISWLFCAVPVGIHCQCQTRLDVRLPLRVGLYILLLCYRAWNFARALVWKHGYSVACVCGTYSSSAWRRGVLCHWYPSLVASRVLLRLTFGSCLCHCWHLS